MLDLRKSITEANGIRDARWDFYYVLRRMEQDALLRAKYQPDRGETIVTITEYGSQQFERTKKALEDVFKQGKE